MTTSEPTEGGRPTDEDRGGPGSWLGPLLLAAAPFVLFGVLFALDRILP
jgi:hypothetical protein